VAIDVVAVGQSGAHSFRKTNVNTEDNYLYFNDAAGETVPSTLSQGTGFIFNNRAGSIGGITDGGLVFVGAQNIDASGGDIVEELEINGVVKKVHTFYTPGTSTFSVNSLNGNTDGVEVYVIGGGGGGTNVSGSSGGGGGGGGVAFGTVNLSAGDYTVTVGDGGAGNTNGNGGNGGTSTFQGLSATGGQGAQGSTGGTGGVGSGGTVNGTGGTGGNGGPSPAPAGSAGTNGGAGGGGGGSDNSKGGDGGDGDAAYFTGGGGAGGGDARGGTAPANSGGTGYFNGGRGASDSGVTTTGLPGGGPAGGAAGQVGSSRTNNGGGGGSYGGGGGGAGDWNNSGSTKAGGAEGGGGAVVIAYAVSAESSTRVSFVDNNGDSVDFTSATSGAVSFNNPIVFDSKLNIDASTATNQAVKYYTAGTPLTGLTSGETYFLKNVPADFAGSQALFTLTNNTHTFTSCGETGRIGPTITQMRAAYNVTWDGTYLKQGDFQGYQDWTVPISGIYEFEAKGASGYNGSGSGTPGLGARVKGRVVLTKGETITIAVGQVGEAPSAGNNYGGSGGGTFVVRKSSNEPLFVAGGGTADANGTSGQNGVLTNDGGFSQTGQPGGEDGNGGPSAGGRTPGGGGFFSRGQDYFRGELGGGSFLDGLTQGPSTREGGSGGFGGGAQGEADLSGQAGGGGGYSGGAGARTFQGNRVGGGGGSFIAQTATNVATSDGTYNTSNTFNGQSITNIGAYHSGDGEVVLTLVTSFTTGNEVYPTAEDANAGTNRIDVLPAGNSFHAFVPINFDIDNDLIYSQTAHGLTSGEAITLNFNEQPPLGLDNSSIYYVDVEDPFSYRLSSTPSPSFTTINLTIPSAREASTSSSFSRVIVNTDQNTLTISNHGFLVDQPLRYSAGGGTPISPLQDNVTYYISEVLDANRVRLKVSLDAQTSINFTAAGTGTAHSFIFETVNPLEDTLYIPNHGLVSGQAVRYDKGDVANTAIPGLIDGDTYYIVKVDNSIVRLATDSGLQNIANISNPDPWTATGTQSLVITSLDFDNDIITLPDHGFLQGELVEYDSRGQTEVAGLTTATPYYVIFIDGDNIKLATTPENAVSGTAVDLQDTPSGVGRHTLQSLSKTPDGIYTIDTVPTSTTFTVTAKGNVPIIEKIFNPRTSIDLASNAFFIPSHGFLTGTEITYSQGDAGTDITGLTDDTQYYVITINRDYLRLATTADNAAAGIALTVSDFGTGVAHSFTTSQINGNVTGGGSVTVASGSVLVNGSGTSFAKVLKVGDTFRLYPPNVEETVTFAATDVNTTNEIVTVPENNLETGDTVKFQTGGGVAPSPLVNGYYYFVRKVSATEITLHNSESDAVANTGAIDFSTQGTGTSFTLTRTTLVGPIIRRVTAVGSDTQITVDRPYASAYNAVSYSFPTFVYVRPEGYSLHRPFDGGVEMSVGSGTWHGQIIRQTRKYFRYQSGKGIQTSAGINFQPSIDIEAMNQVVGQTIRVRTRRPHGLISGLFVVISQAEDSFGDPSQVYNGEFQVTVEDLTNFTISAGQNIPEPRAYGFPQFYVREWSGGAVRSGMFDFQNGMFYEFDGQKLYCVRRSSTQQMAGSVAALRGSELIFGTNTTFQAQLDVGDYVVMRGQTYRVVDIESDTRMSVRPEYKGASGAEKEFDPSSVVDTANDKFDIVGHGFSDSLPVVYNSIDGEAIGGLINGNTYYIDLINNNSFKLKSAPDAVGNVSLSSVGTTDTHSFVPAKSGIIVTKTVDTKIPQENWSIDPCDGSGPTGYNLDTSRIQMIYIDYSWYGAGKIRFGFKTTGGQVQYTHEFVHNNNLYESYFRSGNLPARYEVNTYENPTYIPYLFHWGTSVMMDGTFDDDNAYLFTAGSQTLNVSGTTPKSFSASGINLDTDLIEVLTHGFRTGDVLQFQSLAANGLPGSNAQNPAVNPVGNQTDSNLTNAAKYKAFVNSENLIHLTPEDATITLGSAYTGGQTVNFAQSGTTITVTTTNPHNIPAADNNVGIYLIGIESLGLDNDSYVGPVTVSDATTFTFTADSSATVSTTPSPNVAISEVLDFTSRGNIQYTYFLFPDGSLNNTSGPNYQPLISLRLSPSVSEGLTGALGDRDVLNRMQLRLQEVGISSNELVDVKMLLNPRLNNLNFVGVDSPSLTQIVEHTAQDTVSGGVQVYNFRAAGGIETTVDVAELFELSNSILGGDSIFPDGPDIITIAVSRLTGNTTRTSAKLSWSEAQA